MYVVRSYQFISQIICIAIVLCFFLIQCGESILPIKFLICCGMYIFLHNEFLFIFKYNYNLNASKYAKKDNNQVTSYIINMERSVERLKSILPQVTQLGFSVKKIKAIDGVTISQTNIEKNVSMESFVKFFNRLPELGTIGCSLSHENAWKIFLESDDEFALIFEDDVAFDPLLLKDMINNLIENKNIWDIVSFELSHNGLPLKIKKIELKNALNMNQEHNNYYLSMYLTNVKHAGAYIINRKTAHQFLTKMYPIKMPIDHFFTRAWEFDIKFMGVEPRVVHQIFGDSEIAKTKTNDNKKIYSFFLLTYRLLYLIATESISIIYSTVLYCRYLLKKLAHIRY